jgi:Protein of unknown function (DUF3311)
MDSDQDSRSGGAESQDGERRGSRWLLLLLLLPYIGLLYPPLYSRLQPELWGFPFFIWYQFLWVFITVGITAIVYRMRS